MTRRRWKGGCLVLLAALILVPALGIAGVWLWATRTGSVAALDWVDGLFTPKLARQHIALGPDPRQELYVYPGKPGGSLPVLIFFHGGSWEKGDPGEYGFIARNFAPHGYVVVLAGYRLGEEGRFPHMLEDAASAVAWAHTHAAEYGGDPERILLMGHSAGAYNAAMIALDRQWLGRKGLDTGIVKGVVGLAGPYDFLPFDVEATKQAFGGWPRPGETQPVHYARADAPPMLLATGSDDETVKPRNSTALAKALSDAGRETRPAAFDGVGHGGILMALARPFDWDPTIKSRVLAFLAQSVEAANEATAASAPVKPQGR